MKSVRKFLSVFLIICMIATFAPAAFADGEEAAEEPVTVNITDNGDGTVSVEAEGANTYPEGGTAEGSILSIDVKVGDVPQGVEDPHTTTYADALVVSERGEGEPYVGAIADGIPNNFDVTVDGDVAARNEEPGVGSGHVEFVTKVDESVTEDVNATLTINGNIDNERKDTNDDGIALGVEVSNTGTVEATSTTTVNGNITSESFSYSFGVGGNVNENKGNEESSYEFGKATANINVTGTVTSQGESFVEAVSANAGENGKVDIKIGENVTATATGESSSATAVSSSARGKDASAVIDIGGDVSATSTGEDGYATGMNSQVNGESAYAILVAHGDVTATSASDAIGINSSVSGKDAYSIAKVDSSVTATSTSDYKYAIGVSGYADGENSLVYTEIHGDVSATSGGTAIGVQISTGEDKKISNTIAVDGIISAVTTGEDSVNGVSALAGGEGSEISIEAKGISAQGSEDSYSVFGANLTASTQTTVTATIGEEGITAVGGAEKENGYPSNVGAKLSVGKDATIKLDVAGDVIAESGEGLILASDIYAPRGPASQYDSDLNGPGTIDVFVEGTVSGGNNSILLDSQILTADDVSLTVWRATVNDNGYVVGTRDSANRENLNEQRERALAEGNEEWIADIDKRLAAIDQQEQNADEIEKNILYIIKVGENGNNYDNLEFGNANQEDHGYYVARAYDEAEDNYVSLKAVSGYKLLAVVHGDNDQTVQENIIVEDGDGNYLLLVPKGGGLWLEVKLEKIEDSSSTEYVVYEQGEVKSADGKGRLAIFSNRTFTLTLDNGEKLTGTWKVVDGQLIFVTADKEEIAPTVDADGNCTYTFKDGTEIVLSAATVQAIIAGRKF